MKNQKAKCMRRYILAGMMALLLMFAFAACASADPSAPPPAAAGGLDPSVSQSESEVVSSSVPPSSSVALPSSSVVEIEEYTPNPEDIVMVEITMKNGGVIKLELDKGAAPLTVENFVKLANDEYFDGQIFHRVVKNFMIQGGDPTGTGTGGPGWSIKGEFAENGWDNPISHAPGVISMARSNDPDSAGSQFFITDSGIQPGNTAYLDGKYAAFGKVVEGMDVVDRIAGAATKHNESTGEKSVPIEPEEIESIRVIEE